MFEFSEIAKQPGAVVNWANKVAYGVELSQQEGEISENMNAWAREIGEKGDPGHELSALITKSFSNEEVSAPSELLSRIFNETSIGEFDDYQEVYDPKNTILAHEAIIEGNVDRSFIEHTVGKPQWKSLAAETDISMQDLRRGGYRTVANLITYIKDALELKKVKMTMDYLDSLIVSGNPNYVSESGTVPTAAAMDELALYLHDVSDGETPIAFMLNKYRQAIAKLAQADRWPTEAVKNLYNTTGFVDMYSGVELMSYSGQKKLADGSLILPDKTIYGVAGKIGTAITRGDARVLQEENINAERIHIKVTGFNFGWCVHDVDKIAKIVLS
ncbi:MAG: hypothetical protein J6S14_20810 [Clostridia bacterium]|nr:hypothetical protein [Clostridia bacterium]